MKFLLLLMFARLYAWACDRLYHEFAWSYDLVAWLVSAGQWARWRQLALTELPDARDGDILELGFGTGALLKELAQAGRSVVGLDASRPMVRIAARRLTGLSGSARLVQGAAQALPFRRELFTAVISAFPAPYIVAPETLAECHRVLRTRGRLIIVGLWVTPNNRLLRGVLPIFFGPAQATFISALMSSLHNAGFLDVAVENRRAGWASIGIILASRSISD